MLNIFDFEDDVAYIIAARGRDYFESGNVLSVRRVDELYVGTVRGASDYTVTVELDEEGSVLDSMCTCPYDGGPVCKHEVAVYYALQDELPEAMDSGSSDDLRGILSEQSKERLVDFLMGLASDSREMRSRLGLEFGNKASGGLPARDLINSYINKHSDRDGYIHWDDIEDAVVGAQMVLEKAVDALGVKEYAEALDMVFCVTQELASALNYADDSDGVFNSVLEEAFALMKVIASEADLEDDQQLFNLLLQEAENRVYESGWRLQILDACASLVDCIERRDILNARLDAMGANGEYLARIRHYMIERLEGAEAAAQFALSKVKYPDFREEIIQECLKKGDLEQAIMLAMDGEEQDKQFLGLVYRWKKLRYEAYTVGGQVDKQRELATELVLAGQYEYYLKLRESYLPKEWPEVYPDLLKVIKKQRAGVWDNMYCKALIEEKETGLLLEYVQENPVEVLGYLDFLLPHHPEEVLAVFSKHIFSEALAANKRSKYQGVCGLVHRFAKAGGKERARELTQDLAVRYKQRPAFQEELKRLLSIL